MLGMRLVFGPLMVLAFVALALVDLKLGAHSPLLAALVTLLTVRSMWEFCQLVHVRSFHVHWLLMSLAGAAVVLANWIPRWMPSLELATGPNLGWPMLVFGLSLAALFLKEMYWFESPGSAIETLGAEVLGVAYVAVFASATVQLRWVLEGELFYIPLASLVVISKCGDTAAYIAGHAFGGPKLSPRLSPGKTIAGAIGAVFGGMLGGWAWLYWGTISLTLHKPGPILALLVYGFVLSLSGMAGDLAESLIKRDVSKKDAPALLPGFGGLLDVVDSVFFCGPIAVLLWTFLPLIRRDV